SFTGIAYTYIRRLRWISLLLKKYDMKTIMKLNNVFRLLLLGVVTIAISCEEEDFAENFDINYPVRVIESVTPKEVEAGGEIVITGSDFIAITGNDAIKIGGKNVASYEIISENEIVVTTPETFPAGTITIVNGYYGRAGESEDVITLIYEDLVITAYPAEIDLDEGTFIIQG